MLHLEPSARWAFWRRGLMVTLVLASTAGATWLMGVVLGTNGLTVAEGAVLAVFGSEPSTSIWTLAGRPASTCRPKSGGMTSATFASPRSTAISNWVAPSAWARAK